MADPIVVRHSELKDFRRCPLKHKMKWVDGWRSGYQSDASSLGTAWHAMLEAHYLHLQQNQTRGFRQWSRLAGMMTETELESARDCIWDQITPWLVRSGADVDLLRWMYEGYVAVHGLDPDWEILGVEQELTMKLDRRFSLQVHIDLTVIDHSMGPNGTLLAVDHKSTAQPLGQHGIDLDDQFGLYALVLSRKYGRHAVPVIDQSKTKKLQRPMTLAERHDRKRSFRTAHELENTRLDAMAALYAMHSRDNQTYPYSNPDPRTCDWSCEFLDAHIAARKDRHGYEALPSVLSGRGFTQGGTDHTLPGV